jgi:small basic protein
MMASAMTANTVFLYLANVIVEFLLSLFGLGGGIDVLFTVVIAIVFWTKIFHLIAAIVRRIFGFEKGQ